MVWDVGGEWWFELSDLSFYAVVQGGASGDMTRPAWGHALDLLVPMCCPRPDIPSI
jgi:hypothetical protein